MGVTPQTMVQQCCITIQYHSESGERTEEPLSVYSGPADIAGLVRSLAELVGRGTVASFNVEVRPSPYASRTD